MRNWKAFVARHLTASKLPPDVRDDVITEISDHLEDCWEDLARTGRSDAEDQVRAQVADWDAFGRSIKRSKEDRMGFLRRVAVPGIVAAFVGVASLHWMVELLVAPQPCGAAVMSNLPPGLTVEASCKIVTAGAPVYLSWIALLLLTGACAAAIARRLGARPKPRLVAAISPALYLLAETIVASLTHGFFWRLGLYFVVVPAIVCAIGAIPFMTDRHGPNGAEPIATHS